ncbi:MAG: hypothetical protein WA821_05080 [Anaerolineales bacterium]
MDKAVLEWQCKGDVKDGDKLYCQFNPSELSITKNATWNTDKGEGAKDEGSTPSFNAPKITFGGGGSAKYSLTLFFDATGEKDKSDVRYYTDQLIRLTLRGAGKAKAEQKDADPPTVTFRWGQLSLFKAVVESVKVQYTMFAPDGTPIRAKASVSFVQNDPGEDVAPYQNPSSRSDSRKTYIANSGQRLDQIAYEEYNDARYWRVLAESNDMDNPLDLSDGQILVIHPLD